MSGETLTEEFFKGRVTDIAENLIGAKLYRETRNGLIGGRIVEAEAYLGREDPASHLVKAGKKRGKVFEKGAGTVYVFKIFQHCNLNFITEYNGVPEGVLIRAIEPEKGVDKMKARRSVDRRKELCSGPGKLTEALEIGKEGFNGKGLEKSELEILPGESGQVARTPRIGISRAEDWPLRFVERDSGFLSEKVSQEKSGFSEDEYYRELDAEKSRTRH